MDILEKNTKKLLKQCDDGLKGKFFLYPDTITSWLTNRCNLYCIMCPENYIRYNKKPINVSFKEFTKLIPKRLLIKKIFRHPSDKFFSTAIHFNFMSGETLLNTETYDIVKFIKKQLPASTISILSNGTIPPRKGKEDIVKYIDILSFSIDGCTKDTFEMIRTPANFEHVIKNLKYWSEMRNKYNSKIVFHFVVTLSTMNFHELPGLIRLANQVGGYDSVYVQPLITNSPEISHLEPKLLIHMDKEKGHQFLKEAFEVSKETGIRIDLGESIKQMFGYNQSNQELINSTGNLREFDYTLNRYCQKVSNLEMGFDEKNNLSFVCCFMMNPSIIERYKIPRKGSPFEIYNSIGWWKLRKDMLEGKLLDECKHCVSGNSDYYRLSEINRASIRKRLFRKLKRNWIKFTK